MESVFLVRMLCPVFSTSISQYAADVGFVVPMCYSFFFQAEDGIRDYKVTGVQTCALPICAQRDRPAARRAPLEGADDPGAGKAAMHRDADLGEPRRHELGRAVLLEGGLGIDRKSVV